MTNDEIGSARREKLHVEDAPDLNLSVNDRKVFTEALTNPRPVNDRLRDTVRRYRQATGV
ncbi:DUF1778 domain-containing protein [Mesorhizobium sp. M2E.F.Ca.ET.209.01.1.1]|uniref:type II toxin -antitoxin system TacA 1-like antitoxin n=1 Tax=Mesorhizobium sp. M2E.F.Ca.ET.209.01.1.1 TaxID=2500526 RepID=UPI001AEE4F0C|nr:DUF1778 domain-containing protein [Mesorhizobium sp. M2E.F.Ca.ET.209.01.1.1]